MSSLQCYVCSNQVTDKRICHLIAKAPEVDAVVVGWDQHFTASWHYPAPPRDPVADPFLTPRTVTRHKGVRECASGLGLRL